MTKLYSLDNEFIGDTDRIPDDFTGILEWENGTKLWYLNDKCHRLDGPAVEHSSGAKEWFVNGILHRMDGPAIEWPDATKFWYINGTRAYSEEQHKLLVNIMKLKNLI